MKEKILITDLTHLANRELEALKRVVNILNGELVPLFDSLNIGELTTELLTDMLNDASGIVGVIRQQAQNDIAALKNPAIKQSLLDNVKEQIQGFISSVQSIKDKITIFGDMAVYLEMQDGQIQAVPDAEQTIRDKYKVYIRTDEEHTLYEAMTHFADAYNDVVAAFGEQAKHVLLLRKMDFFMSHYKYGKDGKLSLDTENININALAHQDTNGKMIY